MHVCLCSVNSKLLITEKYYLSQVLTNLPDMYVLLDTVDRAIGLYHERFLYKTRLKKKNSFPPEAPHFSLCICIVCFLHISPSDKHTSKVKTFMLDIMSPLITEADYVSQELLEAILVNMVDPNKVNLLL